MTSLYLQILVNGLLLGGIYTCIALGFSLVWGVMNIINLAHGAFIMLGAYATFWLFHLFGFDPFVSLPLSMSLLFLLGYLVQRYVINLVIRAPLFMTLILTFGIDIFLMNVAIVLFTSDWRSVVPWYAGLGVQVGPIILPYIRLGIFALALSLTGLLFLFLNRTKTGMAIKAAALDREAAQLVGIRIGHIYSLTFAVGSAMAAAGGSLLAMIQAISPAMGEPLTLKSFAICILGGLGSPAGAMVGGFVLGLAETAGGTFLGPSYQDLISYAILFLILLFRPEGLFGRRFFAEVKH